MVLLRGIEPSRFTPRENVLLIAGITSYIGDQRGCQDDFGNMISKHLNLQFCRNLLTLSAHLVDMGFMFGKGSKRTPALTHRSMVGRNIPSHRMWVVSATDTSMFSNQPYHNDVCDILVMYAQESASDGGETLLASSAAVYNEIAATRPDLVKVLTDPVWIYDK